MHKIKILMFMITLVLPDGNFFGNEHEMTLKIEGLEKPKRKRGRPKKVKIDTELSEAEQLPETSVLAETQREQEAEDNELDEHGRKRRRRKVPQRFMEAVQGKELDRILREEGAIDGNESDDITIDEEQFPGAMELKVEMQGDGNEEIAGGKIFI